MREVLKNQRLIGPCHMRPLSRNPVFNHVTCVLGSTMGSHKDLEDATAFMAEHRIVPVVSHILDGLEAAEQGFALLARGEQFGKVVLRVDGKLGVGSPRPKL